MTSRRWFWAFFLAALTWFVIGTWMSPYEADAAKPPRVLQQVQGGLSGIVSSLLYPVRMPATVIQGQLGRLTPTPRVDDPKGTEALEAELKASQRRYTLLEEAYARTADALRKAEQAASISPLIQTRDLLPASISGLSVSMDNDTCTINRGTRHGVAVGMPVLCNMSLVGRIEAVSLTEATVRLVTDPRQRTNATLQRWTPEGVTMLAECSVRGDGQQALRCTTIGTTFTDRQNQTRVVEPPQKGDRLMLADTAKWPGLVQNVEFAVVTEVTTGQQLRYDVRAVASENLKLKSTVMVLLVAK